jgi:acyl-CoA hydrolase
MTTNDAVDQDHGKETCHGGLERRPVGNLSLRTIAAPRGTNAGGAIFCGWTFSQATRFRRSARGRVATVSIDAMRFLCQVEGGGEVTCLQDMAAGEPA